MTNPAQVEGADTRACASPPGLLRSEKILGEHLDRLAFVYVRQSTPEQLVRNRESTEVQYNLRRRAVDLGWLEGRVVVIDEDLGKSGASIEGRVGFQRMVAEVSLGHVGIILGVEMSRLARSCKDWYHLLEVCGVFGTLIADLDGVYDPTHYNDRLLLGLKGTMSEAELHILKQRMYQGTLNKARRGELVCAVPMGYLRRPSGEVVLDPNEEVQEVIRTLFRAFDELGSVDATLCYLVEQGIQMPVRPRGHHEELEWRRPSRGTVADVLRNPLYAGAYAFGRSVRDRRRDVSGGGSPHRRWVPRSEWKVLLKDRMPAYITWDDYEAHQERIKANRTALDQPGVPRQGPALLTGLLICGRCGARMTTLYGGRKLGFTYQCIRLRSSYAGPRCQTMAGPPIDRFVAQQVIQALKPASLELSLRAAEDIERRRRDMDGVWQKRLERVRFEAGRAERHYQHVEPEHRLVARELARQWEAKLNAQRALEEEYDRFQRSQPRAMMAEEREAVRRLATDIPALWDAETTTHADRKEIVRQVIDRVVVDVVGTTERVQMRIEWAGGVRTEHEAIRPVQSWESMTDWPKLVERLRSLRSQGHTAESIAERLNQEGWRPARSKTLSHATVRLLLRRTGLGRPCLRPSDHSQLQQDEWWVSVLAKDLAVPRSTVNFWRKKGLIEGRRSDDGRWIVRADRSTVERLRARSARMRVDRPRT